MLTGPENPENIYHLLNIDPKEWQAAIAYFDKNPASIKFDRKESQLQHSFVNVEGRIYAMAVGEYLGEGSSGRVKVCEDMNGKDFAIKIEGRTKHSEDEAELMITKLLGEYYGQAQRSLKEKNKTFYESDQKLYTVIELKKELNLYAAAKQYRVIDKSKALKLAMLSAQALKRLHAKNIIHGDVQPCNFMINKKGDMFIVGSIDYGLSVLVPEGKDRVNSPATVIPMWAAPEVRKFRAFASDIYSLGYMFSQFMDLQGSELKDLIEQMMSSDPDQRPTLDEIITLLRREINKHPEPAMTDLISSVEKEFDYLYARFSKDPSGRKDRYFCYLHGESEFKGFLLLEIANALNQIASDKGLQIKFFSAENTIGLSRQDYDTLKQFMLGQNIHELAARKLLDSYRDNLQRFEKELQTFEIKMKAETNVSVLEDELRDFKVDSYYQEDFERLQITYPELSREISELNNMITPLVNKINALRTEYLEIEREQRMKKYEEMEKRKTEQRLRKREQQQKQAAEAEKSKEEGELHKKEKGIDNFVAQYMNVENGVDLQSRYADAIKAGMLQQYRMHNPVREGEIKLIQSLINHLYNDKTKKDPDERLKILKGGLLTLEKRQRSGSALKNMVNEMLDQFNQAYPKLDDGYIDQFKQYLKENPDIGHDYQDIRQDMLEADDGDPAKKTHLS